MKTLKRSSTNRRLLKKPKEANDKDLTKKQKQELTEKEKEYNIHRKQIQGMIIKFAIRVPVFMYLTEFREKALRDVITQLDPAFSKKPKA